MRDGDRRDGSLPDGGGGRGGRQRSSSAKATVRDRVRSSGTEVDGVEAADAFGRFPEGSGAEAGEAEAEAEAGAEAEAEMVQQHATPSRSIAHQNEEGSIALDSRTTDCGPTISLLRCCWSLPTLSPQTQSTSVHVASRVLPTRLCVCRGEWNSNTALAQR